MWCALAVYKVQAPYTASWKSGEALTEISNLKNRLVNIVSGAEENEVEDQVESLPQLFSALSITHLPTGLIIDPLKEGEFFSAVPSKQGFFWTFWKKLKPGKTQNSSKFSWKLKQNFRKTQKPPTQLELLQYKSCILIPKMCRRLIFFSKSYTLQALWH